MLRILFSFLAVFSFTFMPIQFHYTAAFATQTGLDTDRDGYNDDVELFIGTDPNDDHSVPADGVLNSGDANPLNPNATIDITAPVVTAPAPVTMEASGVTTAVTLGVGTALDGINGMIAPTNNAPATFPVGATPVIYTATDAAGNIGTATQLVTITDTTAPVIIAPAAVTATSGDNLPVAVTLGSATATDLVDGVIVPTNNAPATFPVGVTTVTYTAMDAAGNIGTATQLVTVNIVDVIAPVVIAPVGVTTEAKASSTAVILGASSATDVVDGILIPTNNAPATFPVGTTTITYTATDAAGNIGTATQLVTITDTTAPVIIAPAAVTATSGGYQSIAVTLGSATATDLVDGVIVPTNNSPATFPVGVTTVTYTATDAAGNIATATQLVTVNIVDVVAPVVIAPTAVTAEATAVTTTVTLGTATATDVVDGVLIPTNNAPATFPVGATPITYTATDAAGNIGTATQLVTITDTTAPVIIAPAAVTATSGGYQSIAVTLGSATAIDLVDGVIVPTNNAPATFPVGITTVTYTATDAAGNIATATQLVTVNLVDVTAPVVTAPVGITTEATASTTTVILGTSSATDVVDGILIPTNNAPATFPVGATTVTYTATDAAGNIGTATQLVTITDMTAPIIIAPAAVTATSGDNQPVAVTLGSATAIDLVDGVIVPTNNAPATFPVGVTTVTYTATDAAGNIATVTQLVTVNLVDVTAPVVSPPAAVTATSGDNLPVAVTLGSATATDLVDGVIVPTNNAPATFPVGVTTVTYTATDAAGNIATATQLVTVNLVDVTAPVVSPPAAITASSSDRLPVTLGSATATDLVDGVIVPTNNAPATFPVGVTTVTYTATDAAGNIGTATQLVTVNLVDVIAPVVTAPAGITTEATASSTAVILGASSATDVVDGILIPTNNAPATFPVGTTTITYTATDAAGNIGTATQLVTITDTTAPTITAPANMTVESTGVLTFVLDLGLTTVTDLVDTGLIAIHDAPAGFSMGTTTVTWSVSDTTGNRATATQRITISDTTAPVITAPTAASATSNDNNPVTVTLGLASATDLFAVTLSNDAPATFPVGITTVTYTATDFYGNVSTATQLVTVNFVDIIAPVLTVPVDVSLEATGASTTVNLGVAAATDNVDTIVTPTNNAVAGGFPVGITVVTWTATDTAGNSSTAVQNVTVTDTTAPSISAPLNVNLVSSDGNPVIDVIGTATATDIVDGAIIPANNAPATFPVGTTTVTYAATDAAGNAATAIQIVTVSYTPPASLAAAAILDGSYGALYRSLVPVDATIAVYNPDRFSIITGIIHDLNGLPVQGATVRIHNHPEYGSSAADVTGRYSLPVDGGALFTVDITAVNYLMVQRQVKTAWNKIYTVDTVALIQQDTKATVVTFDGNPATKIVHGSTPFTDVDGTRATHLVFSGDTTASVTHTDGSVTPLTGPITVRATEFVRPDTMPGNLPPTSAFTYCADIRVDGTSPADSVQFSKPVVMYVDNFLNFPVGEVVPVGYFDRNRAVWVPSDNGVVVQLLDTNANGAVDALDSTGDGLPNDLNADGSFTDEVAGISGNAAYAVGNSYWRTGITHFTPWDSNWPWDLPNGAREPPATLPAPNGGTCEASAAPGSTVSCESRIFSEDISIPGTDFKLHYKASRTAGYKQVITIPLTGATLPASVQSVTATVRLEGRVFNYNVPKLLNQEVTLVWDGLDAYGKRVIGKTEAQVTVEYAYQLIYSRAGGSNVRAFGQPGQSGSVIASRGNLTAKMRQEFDVFITVEPLGDMASDGWSLSAHNQLSSGDTVFRGDGSSVDANPAAIISTFARVARAPVDIAVDADGTVFVAETDCIQKIAIDGSVSTIAGRCGWGTGFSGDGGLAINAGFQGILSLALGSDGSLYIIDASALRVRKIDPQGIVTSIAGNGAKGSSGDGGPAIQASLGYLEGIAVAPDGTIYISDDQRVIRKIDPNGIISKVAGSGGVPIAYALYDGWNALAAPISPKALEVGSDGLLYFSEGWSVYRIENNGTLTRIVGKEFGQYKDNILAVDSFAAGIWNMAFDKDGSLYFSDWNAVRKITPDGIVYTIAGSLSGGFSGDGKSASSALLNIARALAVTHDGSLLIADQANLRIRKVSFSAGLTPAANGDKLYSDTNRGEGYLFNLFDKHTMTIDLDTGIVLKTFGYDIDGSLSSITNRFGGVTQILNSGGVPYAIVAPDGQTTNLNIVNGQLTGVTYPDASGYNFTYSPDGLLTGKTDPNGGSFVYTYDANGRVIQTQDAVLGISQFSTTSAGGMLYQRAPIRKTV